MEKEKDFKNPQYYENRELSWLKFDNRVLNEARDKSIPLLERLKFVSITSSNLDEFYMVRVASLKDMVHANYKKKDIAGMTASEQLAAINEKTREMVDLQYNTYNRSLLPLLKKEQIHIIDAFEDLTEEQKKLITPERSDIVTVYRELQARRWHAEDLQPLCAKLGEENTGKTLVAVTALEQVGLIATVEKGGAKYLELVPAQGKKNLADAPVLKCLEGM